MLHENWAIAKKSSTTPEAKAYYLIPQVKNFFYQAFLIDYAGCDESLECAGCLTLFCPFCFDFQVSTSEAFATAYPDGLLNTSVDSIEFPLMEK